VLFTALTMALFLVLLGWNIRKMEKVRVSVNFAMDLIRYFPPSMINVEIENPSLIPFSIPPFHLELKDADGQTRAYLSSRKTVKVPMLSHTPIPLDISYVPEFKAQDMLKLAAKGAVIEGRITAQAWWISRTVSIRREYALPKMLQNH
ncbi:MAG: hypothetical protein Q8J62_01665, partial [Candidatus Cloacimonadaceae bacterium]|nr:hypothetical protein [Candidatus Cloacimonadaceae bacterium]